MDKVYRLHNGYSISTGTFYNGFHEVTKWCIYAPDGSLYASCNSYNEAYELASHLVNTPELMYDKQADLYCGCFDEF